MSSRRIAVTCPERAPGGRAASSALATRAAKDAALLAMADALDRRTDEVLAANADDVDVPRTPTRRPTWSTGCRLTADRVEAMADGLRDLAGLPDPVGEVVRGSTLANGLELRQVRVPFGVVGMIYEGRPNVTADAAGICLKSGNAVLLRGSSSAARSNAALVACCARRSRRPGCRPTSSSWSRPTRARRSRS